MVLYYEGVIFMAYFLKKSNTKKALIFKFMRVSMTLNERAAPTVLTKHWDMYMSFRPRASKTLSPSIRKKLLS